MRIGLLVRADRSGLGYQTKALYHLLEPDKTLLIDSTPFNGREQNYDWYDKATVSDGFPTTMQLESWLTDLDVVITCETPYNYDLFRIARDRGIKSVLQPNWEFLDYLNRPELPRPDAFFIPSTWFKSSIEKLGKTYLCPPPIDLQPSDIERIKQPGKLHVLHIAGMTTYKDRNGTDLVRRACRDLPGVTLTVIDQNTKEVKSQEDMYGTEYDCLLLPRKYGGLCLPMLEALSQGLPVLMTHIDPNDFFLPKDWLIPVIQHDYFQARTLITYWEPRVLAIQNKLIEMRDKEDYDIEFARAKRQYEVYLRYIKWDEYLKEVVG